MSGGASSDGWRRSKSARDKKHLPAGCGRRWWITSGRAVTGCCFCSSRRRHTRFDCDWSSDVCSSDLQLAVSTLLSILSHPGQPTRDVGFWSLWAWDPSVLVGCAALLVCYVWLLRGWSAQIGRASCRERV